ncbi:hypothetical protein D9M73_229810 [compost metagenome]
MMSRPVIASYGLEIIGIFLANASLAPIDVKISPLISIDGGETDKTSPFAFVITTELNI